LTGVNFIHSQEPMLNPRYLQLVQQKLSKFAGQDDFAAKMEIAFGRQIDRSELADLAQQWQQGDFTGLPEIEVLQNGELGTANGAYAAANQTIYLASTFLATANTEEIIGVLIEEIGHAVDTVLNLADASGDEGALFSALVQGQNLSASEIISLQSEDDRALVTIDGQQLWVEQDNVPGTAGNDTLVGATNSGDTIRGLAGNDSLTGLIGNDTLIGGSGSDTMTGGAGSDTFVLENFNGSAYAEDVDVVTDFIRGTDKIDVSGLGISDFSTISALTVNETVNSVTSAVITTYNNGADNRYGKYSLKLTGINRSTLLATDFNFATATTNDNIIGGAENDDLFGGFGDDTLNGGNKDDRLFGENGNDRLIGGSGSDTLTGGAGSDTFVLENFNGSAYAQDLDVATDFIRGTDKIDVSGLGISDFSTISALTVNETVNSVTSAVITTYNNGADNRYGKYSLKLTGINRSALLATDFNFATATTNDNIIGGAENDDLFGGFGDDTLNGGNKDDRLFGENGTDRLIGGSGSDTLTGGAGSDTFVLENFNGSAYAQDSDVATDFVRGVDKIDVSGLGISDFSTILALTSNETTNSVTSAVITTYNNGADNRYGKYSLKLTGVDTGLLSASDFNFATTTFNNELLGTANNDDLFGGLGNDPLNGGAGDDRLFGENGIDRLVGGIGSDTLTGGAGSDTFVLENFNGSAYAQDADVVTDFVRGTDKIDVSGLGISDFSTILTLTSNDVSNSAVITTYNNGADNRYGKYSLKLTGIDKGLLSASDFNFATTTFNNELLGTANNDDLFGGLGNDPLNGGAGDDRLFGENGNDTLTGGGGKDLLYGGLGNDTYVVQNNLAGGTVIEDAGGTDTLQLSATVSSTTGWRKSGTSILVDLNADQLFDTNDLTIKNFFNSAGGQGIGFIENLANLSGSAIVDRFKAVRTDFDGDTKSDLLWRNNDGSIAMWQMNGSSATATSIGALPTGWSIAGTADFNADAKADILLSNTNGSVAMWQMSATPVGATMGTLTSGWSIAGTGDFNGDGNSDVLLRNTNGTVATWQTNGSTVTQSSVIGTANSDWTVAGTADFNGDGKADILLSKTDGSVALWQMNGSAVLNARTVNILAPASGWSIAGTADFNADGNADILLRNTDGRVATWEMNGATITGANSLGVAPTDWKITGTGDFNGDLKADILWRNTMSNDTATWQSGANGFSGGLTSLQANSTWNIAAPIG
jgi:Ca2+-binding RTX toxin-like protein